MHSISMPTWILNRDKNQQKSSQKVNIILYHYISTVKCMLVSIIHLINGSKDC